MPRKKSSELTERESEIMEVLWEDGPSSSEHIRKRMTGKPHDSSVRTLLRILVKKNYAKVSTDKRPSIYTAVVKKGRAQKRAVTNLLKRLFGDSAESLVLRLLEDEQLTVEQLNEIKKSVQSKLKDGNS